MYLFVQAKKIEHSSLRETEFFYCVAWKDDSRYLPLSLFFSFRHDHALKSMNQKLLDLQMKILGSAAATLGKDFDSNVQEEDAATILAKQQRAHRKMQ